MIRLRYWLLLILIVALVVGFAAGFAANRVWLSFFYELPRGHIDTSYLTRFEAGVGKESALTGVLINGTTITDEPGYLAIREDVFQNSEFVILTMK